MTTGTAVSDGVVVGGTTVTVGMTVAVRVAVGGIAVTVNVGVAVAVTVGTVVPAMLQKFPGATALQLVKLYVFPIHSKTLVFEKKVLPVTVKPAL